MGDYIALGARPQAATADTTQRNTGNYTNFFSPAVLNQKVPYFEVYHALFTGGRLLDSVTIWIGSYQYSFASVGLGGGSEWDPDQPMLLRPGDELYFFWTTPATVTPAPQVTLWLRYDTSLRANAAYQAGPG